MRNQMVAVVVSVVTLISCSPPVMPPPEEPACPAQTGTVVKHTTDITTTETWAGDGTLHIIDFGISVRPGGTLILDPCAVVQVGAGLIWSVAGDVATSRPAKLISNGTPKRPVTISRKVADQPWGQLRAYNVQSFIELSNTTISGGGIPSTAMILFEGASDLLTVQPLLKADNLTLENAGGSALVMTRGAAFTSDSTSLTIKGGGPAAGALTGDLELTPRAANTIPPSLTITGNQQNLIRLSDLSLIIERDVTLRNFGVPYHFYFDRVRVHSSTATPKLTIEAGAVLQFDDYLMIGSDGSTPMQNQPGVLDVKGTDTKKVVFTSFTPTHAAGDWPGVWLRNAAGSKIVHARIEAGGGFNGVSSANCKPNNTNDWASLNIGWGDNSYIPSPADFSNVEISTGAGHAINAMWTNGDFGPDITGGFTFTGYVGCKQTKNRRPTGCGMEAGCVQ